VIIMKNATRSGFKGTTAIMAFDVLACALPGLVWSQSTTSPAPGYELVRDIDLGAPNVWDYLTVDADAGRVYVSHQTRIDVIDEASGKVLGRVDGFEKARGVAIASKAGKGYASDAAGVIRVFSLKDFEVLKEIVVPKGADGLIHDPATDTILNSGGDSDTLTVINVKTDEIARKVSLPGSPEYLAADGEGNVFVNITNKNAIAKVAIKKGTVLAVWPMNGCKGPHGLAFDARAGHLFSSCANQRLMVVDAATGRNLASFPVGKFSDGVVFDPVRRRAISSNGFGTMTVVSASDDGSYSAHDAPTFFGGRTIAINSRTGTVYIAHGNMTIESSLKDLSKLRFGWDGLKVAVLKPRE
jgi:hypothetical protein